AELPLVQGLASYPRACCLLRRMKRRSSAWRQADPRRWAGFAEQARVLVPVWAPLRCRLAVASLSFRCRLVALVFPFLAASLLVFRRCLPHCRPVLPASLRPPQDCLALAPRLRRIEYSSPH